MLREILDDHQHVLVHSRREPDMVLVVPRPDFERLVGKVLHLYLLAVGKLHVPARLSPIAREGPFRQYGHEALRELRERVTIGSLGSGTPPARAAID